MVSDGGGLHLQKNGDSASWIFRFTLFGRPRYMGLGSAQAVKLDQAREKTAAARRMVGSGGNPLTTRRAEQARKPKTFDECAKANIAAHEDGWKNPVHRKQWETTLTTYANPELGDVPVNEIDVDHVLRAIKPIWKEKNETAARVRGCIEAVLDWATVMKYRTASQTRCRRVDHPENEDRR